ncbi:hypothetical protein IFO69_00160 [Echinicola sp. CAU 1574]|uniref:Uncharacterized protein n=1 Tax=Echinicola arenosa TaxID=2774144 RepID=A0ABR9AFZ0_9BACT|nr:hypothetical protein [Echinicola arenosa]MBD8487146.1 hypothetical protein [Echinicola arenosa]
MYSNDLSHIEIPSDILMPVFDSRIPAGFFGTIAQSTANAIETDQEIKMILANLPKVLDWLHEADYPQVLEKRPCGIPLFLYDKNISFRKVLFHYDGTPSSAKIIRDFLMMFEVQVVESQATIISPSFIPKSKIAEEQALIQLISDHTKETSFIKFNFTKIGDFWSYATKRDCSLLVTTKDYQADLAKVLFHFYKGDVWHDNLSFYLA